MGASPVCGKVFRFAAERVAFDVLEPALRSRGRVSSSAELRASESQFRADMEALFTEDRLAGRLLLPTLETVLQRIAHIEERLAVLESKDVRA